MLADLSDGRLLFGVIVLLLALIASQGVSYLRARGESLGIDSRSGLMTRPERVVLLSLGLALGQPATGSDPDGNRFNLHVHPATTTLSHPR